MVFLYSKFLSKIKKKYILYDANYDVNNNKLINP